MAESAAGPAPKPSARRRTTRKTRPRKTGATTVRRRTPAAGVPAGASSGTASAAPRKRGRPVGSKTRRVAASNPAEALTKRVQALVRENETLRDQVKELEKGWKKIEKALGGNVTRARRAVRREAKSVRKRVTKALE